MISWLARALYNEPYLVATLESSVDETSSAVVSRRRLRWHGRNHRIEVTGDKPASRPADDSDEHFFKEHHWGFGRDRRGRTLAYEVRHPVWDVYPVRSWSLEFDWAEVYGRPWSALSSQKPASVMLAAGSPVSVYPRGRI
jgi:hypothetical protein